MPTYPLPYRITDFLKRQIAWTEAILAELEDAGEAGDESLEELLRQQQRREREAGAMAREYRGLAHEWQCEGGRLDKATRAAIGDLSLRAQQLTEVAQRRFGQAQNGAEARAREKRDALNDLRRDRRSVTIYRPDILVSPGFIDKKT